MITFNKWTLFFGSYFTFFSVVGATESEIQQQMTTQRQKLLQLEQQLAEVRKEQQALKKQSIASAELKENNAPVNITKNWEINSYGSVLYKSEEVFRNTQDIDPDRRATTDLERVVLELKYDFTEQWQAEIELEYEHGGTGSSLEYDGFEEFGEFESEIEAGGEVVVEKMQVKFHYSDALTVKFGRIFVPVGLGTLLHKPDQYFSTERHWSEATLIPQVWSETGVNFIGNWQEFTFQTLITTGLNSEYFRSYSWVATGHQQRFEHVNADDLALTLRLDYGNIEKGTGLGASFYNGDTTGNRNNADQLEGDGNLTILGVYGAWQYQQLQLRGQYLYGNLDDSEAITLANKTTPGLKPGNFSQLGSKAESAFFEAAYNTQHLFSLKNPLLLFANFEYANPMKEVEQGNATERFDISELSIGVNYLPIKQLVFKAQISQQFYQQENLDDTHAISFSLGYFFSI